VCISDICRIVRELSSEHHGRFARSNNERNVDLIYAMSVLASAGKDSAPSGQIFMKSDTLSFRKYIEEFQVPLNPNHNGCFICIPLYICASISLNSS